MFRIAGKPVVMSGTISVDDGDDVTAAGRPGREGLTVFALRDNASGFTTTIQADSLYAIVGLLILCVGLVCGSVVIGESSGFSLGGVISLLLPWVAGGLLIRKFIHERNRIHAALATLDQAQ
ncbi:hypothetical protein HNQ61_000467 [Longimicrobium terrae]|uniref:Uncharacterized protein n=2 Tax=Longimicrobium terrae TaxID=1639882 RepID=A0A841GWS0_9BACT|nr:hypothetical protein [Longimicrobium terrae]